MLGVEAALSDHVRIGLVGAERIGTSYDTLSARRVIDAGLVTVTDPRPGASQTLAAGMGCRTALADIESVKSSGAGPVEKIDAR